VCGNQITDPDDYLLIGNLSGPSTGPLEKFNYTHLHKSHIGAWKHAEEFLALAREALDGGHWRGRALLDIVRTVEAGMLAGAEVQTK
jgi:hypothetical protein